ncbi:hypothetical protein EYF80_053137 [Liparis tanakae]|uniref:Uncharacterized protein n=1 Tax=Liparis tanakae TaxID=230148 RepID=A0A4Z2F8S2_9TELE|nr:hypothetical protein EYF80_053137 [Liparis tanakae]
MLLKLRYESGDANAARCPLGLIPAPPLATTSTTALEVTGGSPAPCNKELITEVQQGVFFIRFHETLNQTTENRQLDFMCAIGEMTRSSQDPMEHSSWAMTLARTYFSISNFSGGQWTVMRMVNASTQRAATSRRENVSKSCAPGPDFMTSQSTSSVCRTARSRGLCSLAATLLL